MSTTVTVTQTVNDVTVDESVYDITLTAGSAFVANLNDLADVDTTGVQDNYVLSYNAATSSWDTAAQTGGSGGGTPGGSNTQVQFNSSGSFAGDAGFTYNSATDTATIGNLVLTNALPVAQGGTGSTSASAARTALGLGTAAVVATDLADLNEATIEAAIDTLANLTSIQGRTVTLADAGADAIFGWDDSANAYVNLSAGDARTALGLVIGTNVQAWDAQLDDIAALAVTDGNFIVGNGTNWVAESGSTARASLGLGTTDSVTFRELTLSGYSGTGDVVSVAGTMTNTSNGAVIFANFTNTITPASNSLSDFRAINFANYAAGTTGITLDSLEAGHFEGARVSAGQDGAINSVTGIVAWGLVPDSGSPATITATSLYGINAYAMTKPSGTSSVLSTTVVGINATATNAAGLTATDVIGVRINNNAAGNTITNCIGLDVQPQTRGGTYNIGVKIQAPSGATNNFALQLSDTGGTAAGGIAFATDTTLHRSAANVLTLNGDLVVSDEAYGVGWNGSLEVPTKNAVYDKIESISAGTLPDGDYGDITVSSSGTVFNIDAATVGVTELSATGTPSASTFLRGDNTWATPSGSGDVSKVGTPVNNQIGVWTGDGTLEGDTALTFDTTTDSLVIAASGNLLFGAVTILDDNAGTMTLSNIDALDATTEATIEAAIDTLANLTSIQGRTVTLADAGANAIFGWDDTAGAYENLSQAEARAVLGLGTAAYVATDLADLNEATIESAIDTLANLTSVQGQAISLSAPFTLPADPNADRILFWDDSAGATAYLAPDSSLAISGTTVQRAALTGDVTASAGSNATTLAANFTRRTLTFVIDGGGSTITTGAKTAYVQVPFNCTITGWTVLGDQSGSVQIDIWKDTYANYPPTDADSITASAPLTVTTATKNTSTTLTGWTTTITAGDILEVNVDSVTSFTKLQVFLNVTVTA